MSGRGAGNLLVLQGGGPTPVLNASLFGVLDEVSRQRSRVGRVLGARHGIIGLTSNDLIDLSNLSPQLLQHVRISPGATLGTTRFKPSEAEYGRVIDTLRAHDIRYLVLIGGNGSLRGAHLIAQLASDAHHELHVIGVPKTIDNDIHATDRCPGFGSAARYVAQSVRDLGMDVRALPQPVSIYETMGRGVGWLAAAAMLGRIDADHAPHLIYLPEKTFDVESFLGEIDRVVTKHGHCVAVIAEGLRGANGKPIFETEVVAQADALGRAVSGDVAAHLAGVVADRLKIRCRSEKPGLCGRASMLHVSGQDLADAELVGRAGSRAAIEGHTAEFVSLLPLTDESDAKTHELIPLDHAAGGERCIPAEWLGTDPRGPVTDAMLAYLRRIVGPLIDYATPLITNRPRVYTSNSSRPNHDLTSFVSRKPA